MFIPEELYRKIIKVIPIPCVDLLVTDAKGRILLLKRNNQPAKGEWWFPGGRILFGELRKDAAVRKLKEECGLVPLSISEVGTYDLILELPHSNSVSHGITTLYHAKLLNISVEIDGQSCEFAWESYAVWQKQNLHDFISNILYQYNKSLEG